MDTTLQSCEPLTMCIALPTKHGSKQSSVTVPSLHLAVTPTLPSTMNQGIKQLFYTIWACETPAQPSPQHEFTCAGVLAAHSFLPSKARLARETAAQPDGYTYSPHRPLSAVPGEAQVSPARSTGAATRRPSSLTAGRAAPRLPGRAPAG